MTGDAPQPEETPRDDGAPWSDTDPASPWWRPGEADPATAPSGNLRPAAPAAAATASTPTLDQPQPAQHTGAAAEAHRAGAQDVLAALTGEVAKAAVFTVPDHPPTPAAPAVQQPAEPPPAELKTAAPATTAPATTESVTAAPATAVPRHAQPGPDRKAGEHDHDRVDAERFNAEGDSTAYAARNRARPVADSDRETTIIDVLNTIPVEPLGARTGPEVMVLPEPDRNRPTVALERGSGSGRPPSGPGRAGADRARADRALQDRVRQERSAALLETSPFWKAEEERRPHSWSSPEDGEKPTRAGHTPRHHAAPPRRPSGGLLGMLVLGLVAAFFAWVSAEPFWLAVGHGDQGTATVERCTGSSVTQRCTGQFLAAGGAYRVDELALVGVEPGRHTPGANSPARMVNSDSRQAYVGSTGVLVHLRWALSFALVLLCGLGIAGLTGARRLDSARARRGATLASVAAPLVLLGGFLFVAY